MLVTCLDEFGNQQTRPAGLRLLRPALSGVLLLLLLLLLSSL
jgi:hypothetical protein